MNIDTGHFGIHVHSREAAEAIYVGAVGFEVLQRLPVANPLAVQDGALRISIFADATLQDIKDALAFGATSSFAPTACRPPLPP